MNGQPDCGDLSDTACGFPLSFGEELAGVRINTPANTTSGAFTASVVHNEAYNTVWTWQTNFDTNVVICKAANANAGVRPFLVYVLDGEYRSGNHNAAGLLCPNEKGISHLDFCGPVDHMLGPATNDGSGPVQPPACPLTCNTPPSSSCAVVEMQGTCSRTCDPSTHFCVMDGPYYCGYAFDLKADGTQCRAQNGECDVAEVCDGVSPTCPEDGLRAAGETCRAKSGACDVEDTCDGTIKDCGDDIFVEAGVECRAAAGDCDVAEECTGKAAACPSDDLKPSTAVCRPLDNTPGSCDEAEHCTGYDAECPNDAGLSTGMVYKCGLTHFFTGGLDPTDVFGTASVRGGFGSLYLAGDGNCNIGASKNTVTQEEGENDEWETEAGCAPALCPYSTLAGKQQAKKGTSVY
jgi:hypothetical protein